MLFQLNKLYQCEQEVTVNNAEFLSARMEKINNQYLFQSSRTAGYWSKNQTQYFQNISRYVVAGYGIMPLPPIYKSCICKIAPLPQHHLCESIHCHHIVLPNHFV